MRQMICFLAKNRYRYFKHFFKTFAPVLLMIALLLGAWILTSGQSFLALITKLPFAEYQFLIWFALAVLSAGIYFLGKRSGVFIYHATIHFFYNTEYLPRFLFCIYCKKLLGDFLIGAILAGLLTNTFQSFLCCSSSITAFVFSIEMLKWFRFNSKKKRWNVLCVISCGLLLLLRELYVVVGAMGAAAYFIYAGRMKINYTKWLDECAFLDEATFASAKKDLRRMYHIQSMAKAKKLHSCSYPLWTLKKSNALIQKALIRLIREDKKIWIIWAIPVVTSIFAEMMWPEIPFANLIKTGAVCIFLSVMNQYLYRDFFEILNKSDAGLFLPYNTAALFAQGLAVPAMMFFALAVSCVFFLKIGVVCASLLFLVWVLSFAALLLYRLYQGNPGKAILMLESSVQIGLTFALVL